jgi:hypothetical protein
VVLCHIHLHKYNFVNFYFILLCFIINVNFTFITIIITNITIITKIINIILIIITVIIIAVIFISVSFIIEFQNLYLINLFTLLIA